MVRIWFTFQRKNKKLSWTFIYLFPSHLHRRSTTGVLKNCVRCATCSKKNSTRSQSRWLTAHELPSKLNWVRCLLILLTSIRQRVWHVGFVHCDVGWLLWWDPNSEIRIIEIIEAIQQLLLRHHVKLVHLPYTWPIWHGPWYFLLRRR